MQGVRPPHPDYLDPARRSSILSLYDEGFAGLSERIRLAAAAGFAWEDVTEPFVTWEAGRAVAHVGVLEHRVRLAGQTRVVAGLHAVVTRVDARGQGQIRRLLGEALRWVDARWPTAKLGTDLPEVYAPHGFRPFVVHRFELDGPGGGEPRGRALDPVADRAWFLDLCDRRAPVSEVYASLDPGWLVGIDLALQRRSLAHLVFHEDLGVVVDRELRDGVLEIHEVFGEELPPPRRAAPARPAPPRRTPLRLPRPPRPGRARGAHAGGRGVDAPGRLAPRRARPHRGEPPRRTLSPAPW